mmetsp:Transcript_111735/g.316344  ORF Transcript_111735/g.316344 Transcript_111735/m.316344 type:complete len:323 (-) Transcript_111735:655-1623(-)
MGEWSIRRVARGGCRKCRGIEWRLTRVIGHHSVWGRRGEGGGGAGASGAGRRPTSVPRGGRREGLERVACAGGNEQGGSDAGHAALHIEARASHSAGWCSRQYPRRRGRGGLARHVPDLHEPLDLPHRPRPLRARDVRAVRPRLAPAAEDLRRVPGQRDRRHPVPCPRAAPGAAARAAGVPPHGGASAEAPEGGGRGRGGAGGAAPATARDRLPRPGPRPRGVPAAHGARARQEGPPLWRPADGGGVPRGAPRARLHAPALARHAPLARRARAGRVVALRARRPGQRPPRPPAAARQRRVREGGGRAHAPRGAREPEPVDAR